MRRQIPKGHLPSRRSATSAGSTTPEKVWDKVNQSFHECQTGESVSVEEDLEVQKVLRKFYGKRLRQTTKVIYTP